MTRRKLTDDEIDLWQKVVKHAERLHADREKKGGDHADPPAPKPKPKPHRAVPASLPHFEVGSKARGKLPGHDLKASPSRKLASDPLRMDEKAFRRMKRGKLKPEGIGGSWISCRHEVGHCPKIPGTKVTGSKHR